MPYLLKGNPVFIFELIGNYDRGYFKVDSIMIKKSLESDLSGPRESGFSPDSCCLGHDVSKPPRFLLNRPGRANGSDLAQRARFSGKA